MIVVAVSAVVVAELAAAVLVVAAVVMVAGVAVVVVVAEFEVAVALLAAAADIAAVIRVIVAEDRFLAVVRTVAARRHIDHIRIDHIVDWDHTVADRTAGHIGHHILLLCNWDRTADLRTRLHSLDRIAAAHIFHHPFLVLHKRLSTLAAAYHLHILYTAVPVLLPLALQALHILHLVRWLRFLAHLEIFHRNYLVYWLF